jgi:2-polyprenyl-6-methoxyphenol hydroxylase-like FAD-dependent oxidoreductase
MRMIYQQDGSILRLPETARSYTAWDVLLREFEATVGEENILRGRALDSIEQTPDKAIAVLTDGIRIEGDLLVAADGVGSRVRSLLLPGSEPAYAGYVAWRGTVDEAALPRELRTTCADAFCSFTGDQTNIVAYEIPGPDGSIEAGRRRVNWVWYVNVAPGNELDCLLVGASGRKKRSTLPRGEARPETVERMVQSARDLLPPKFATIIEATKEPFAQAILDYQAPRLFFGRSVLIGDAACLIRPHLGSGTSKAVEDAVSLADAVCGPDFRERGCLRAWEETRLEEHDALAEQAKAVARRIGVGYPAGGVGVGDSADAERARSRTA